MKDETRNRIFRLIEQNHGYIKTAELRNNNIHNKYLSQLEESGEIEKVKRGLYKSTGIDVDDELIDVSKMIEQGVLCLVSAASFYNLITLNPLKYYVALERGVKIKLPDYPPIKIIYYSNNEYYTGITNVQVSEHLIKVYDMEKTVCDLIRYRNKIGVDIMKEALNNYIRRKDKNITKLIDYSKKLRVHNVLKSYLDVII